jgi:hypothetical protein
VLTAVGPVPLSRGYFTCRRCGEGLFGADAVLGVRGYLTAGAQRIAVLAGVRDSFARAEQLLSELAGWQLDDETIRRLTHAAAARATATRAGRSAGARFARADGEIEVQIDAGKVNTREGWRDVKLGVFAKREAGAPTTLDNWADRDLPAPGVRAVVAAVEEADEFAGRVRAEADRLGVTTAADVTVLGDGAEWIWNLAADVVPQAAGVLDAFHAIEHIAGAAAAVWGDGTAEAEARTAAGRVALLRDGKAGIERWVGVAIGAAPVGGSTDPLLALAAYFAKHPTRLGYADRLADGRSIGSGLVEGAVKQLVNRRLKLTGARWRVDHVGPLVELAALADSPDWHALWTAA